MGTPALAEAAADRVVGHGLEDGVWNAGWKIGRGSFDRRKQFRQGSTSHGQCGSILSASRTAVSQVKSRPSLA